MKSLSHFFKNKVVVVIALLLTLFIAIATTCYTRHGKIIAVEYDYDDCIVADQAGVSWLVSGSDSRACGDNVVMLIWNHFTPSIDDDIILLMR